MRCLRTHQQCSSIFSPSPGTHRGLHRGGGALSPIGNGVHCTPAASDTPVVTATLTNYSAAAAAPDVDWWREWPSRERLERIDTLAYLLGRYPRTFAETASAASVKVSSATTPALTSSLRPAPKTPTPSSSFPVAKQRLTKGQKLSALNAHAVPARSLLATAPAAPSSSSLQQHRHVKPDEAGHQDRDPTAAPASVVDSVPARRLLATSSAPTVATGAAPFTQLAVVEERARRWLQRDRQGQRQVQQAQAADDEAWQALLQHPPSLYADESAVASRFGMGGFVTPHTQGFNGLFRQQWQDFHVTEMVVVDGGSSVRTRGEAALAVAEKDGARQAVKDLESCGGRPLSRDFKFSIPPLPSSLMEQVEEGGGSEGRGAVGYRCEETPEAAAKGAPADPTEASFFQVDVRTRIQQLQKETVPAKDRQAAVEALRRDEQRHGPRMPSAVAPGSAAVEGDADVMSSRGGTQGSSLCGRTGALCDDGASTGAALPEYETTLLRCASGECAESDDDASHRSADGERHHYLQCTLHKQHMAHGNALAHIAQTLRIHPRSISVAGIKDYIGDTVQRVRLESVSPAAALEANRRFRRKGLPIKLSDFSYESRPLMPGDLFGNHFHVVLRDVSVPRAALADAIAAFGENGFPNYYGCQRFSWFGGKQDAAFALLRHNWLAFAFLFLNYTDKDRSLRELLQRPKKYPHPSQDEYRRRVVRRLRQIAVEPTDLDVGPFLSCPPLSAVLTHADGQPFSKLEELICAQLRDAYFDLHSQSRRLTAQRLSSFLWNQVLTLRLHHLGGARVLDGDMVAPAATRQLSTSVEDRRDWFHTFGDRATAENRHRYTIQDVVHPGFSFDGIALPQNIIGAYYLQICDKYRLDWMAQHSRSGLKDFREPPRPIIRKPLDLSYEYDEAACVLTLRFALERGCYANVALSELMKAARCLGSEAVTVLPLPESLWSGLGEGDHGYVTTLQDIYEGYEDGVGFVNDEAHVEVASGSETKVWDHQGPLFLPGRRTPSARRTAGVVSTSCATPSAASGRRRT
ncbi:tRNA_pseudouridine_synthase_D_(TruD) [Leishmania braziliensis MHOM/BR/75/M2904]|uniref:tRNA_pseudouridine_synthase_D_(TruD) n=1 Tax=Leishmania braziliensis MHOM/BR/75/M2904 TaxID=420245 RepID=A0A3P3ZAX3_LEIBR|nr:tRNA_pseudouridine_synthase_D_(TruD) [Leishmania braziliensis MHOM/BR/75/M2904]